MRKKALLLIIAVLFVIMLVSCSGADEGSTLIGTWEDKEDGIALVFREDGTMNYEIYDDGVEGNFIIKGTWKAEKDILTLSMTFLGETVEDSGGYRLDGDKLILLDDDGNDESVYVKLK